MSYGQEKDYIGCAGRDIFCADKGIDRNPSGGSRQIQDCRASGDIDIGRNLSPSVADDIGDGFFARRGLDGGLRQFHRSDGLFCIGPCHAHILFRRESHFAGRREAWGEKGFIGLAGVPAVLYGGDDLDYT